MPRTRDTAEYEGTKEAIKAIARKQMAAAGTASLSLRAIARELDMTAPALYRYFATLDELITALIYENYHALADAILTARAAQPADDFAAQLMAALLAYREWALAHPVDFQLIFGNPIPGYEAPREVTLPAARRNYAAFADILHDALNAGQLHLPPAYAELPPGLRSYLAGMGEHEALPAPPPILYLTLVGWARAHGMIMLELFDHSPPVIGDPAAFYRREVQTLMLEMGMTPPA